MMARAALNWTAACALIGCLVLFSASARGNASAMTGTWTLDARSKGAVHIDFAVRADHSDSEWGRTRALSDLRFLTAQQVDSNGTTAHFSVRSDAGTLNCDGTVGHGKGGGIFAFVPDSRFAADFAQRGMRAPTPAEEFQFTMAGLTMADIDALRRAGYNLSPADLLRLLDHGVDLDYVGALGSLGYHHLSIDELVRLSDDGVTIAFIKQIKAQGLDPSVDDLIRLRDAGV